MSSKWSFPVSVWSAFCAALVFATVASADPPSQTQPRIVNIYSFCRGNDFRMPDSENFLFQATAEQIKVVHAKHLAGTWALQYDALINPRYQHLMKEQLTPADDIGGWWEMTRQLIEKAGIKWRGAADWDPSCRVDYSCAYTPEERIRIADIYMADFKAIYGHYPATVGGWYIDEITLAHLVEKYGIVASCNCQDRVRATGEGVGYTTLWGTYWNQGYYPSKLNAYMPAQTRDQQIDVPIFRMLGSDPIYQYARVPAVYAMEAAYASSGGSTKWVDWYLKSMVEQPTLGFAYLQVGQENSFGWDLMKQGFSYQIAKVAEQAEAGKIRVETLKKTGEWFKSQYKLTPPTAVVCLDDWRYQGRKSIWYNSRYYRVNLLWEKMGF